MTDLDPGLPVKNDDDLRQLALRRLKKRHDFYGHLLVYTLVNTFIVVIWALTDGNGFFWPIFPIAGWGIGLVANAYEAYVKDDPTAAQVEAEVERLRRR